jgi:phage terminase large subunit-like protein
MDPWQADILTASLGETASGHWSAFEVAVMVARQNGKGSILEARELAGLLLFGEKLIMHTAHEMKTAMEGFRRMRELLQSSRDLERHIKRIVTANGNETIELKNGARLRFVARSKGSGRGFSGDLVILDEAYGLTDPQIDALMPTLSARPNPQIWYTSSAPLDATCEHLYRLRERGAKGAPDVALFDYGCAPGVDLDDRKAWAASNPGLGIRISETFIQRERESMSDAGFARERLGVWPERDADSGPINRAAWRQLIDVDSQAGDDIALAVDVTPDRSAASIAVYSPRPDGVGHVELIDHRPGTDWLVGRLTELAARWCPVAVALDSKGPAGSLLDEIARAGIETPADAARPSRGQLAMPTAPDMAAACGQLADAVAQSRVRHLDQAPLNRAVANVRTRPLGEAWAWARKTSSTDISPLVAVTLARWCYVTRAERLATEAHAPTIW